MTRARVALLMAMLSAAGCKARDTCLGGDCRDLTTCAPVAFPTCADPTVRLTTLDAAAVGGWHTGGATGDILLENDRVRVVIDDLRTPHLVAPSGGNILDLHALGVDDSVNQVTQIAGILPDDAFFYDSIDLVPPDELGAGRAAVIVRGHLFGRSDVEVATRYELDACEPGVRVHTELANGGSEPFTFFVADVAYWGGKDPIPFTPLAGQGYAQPELDLVTLDAWGAYPFVATNGGLAWVSCSKAALEGVNDDSVTAVGEPRQIVAPGERVTFDRYLVAGGATDAESPTAIAHALRKQLGHDDRVATLVGKIVVDGPGDWGPGPIAVLASQLGGGQARPWSQASVASDGTFSITVPTGVPLAVEAWQFGRVATVDQLAEAGALADLHVPRPARLRVTVQRGDGTPRIAQVTLRPADAATETHTRGTQLGRFEACAPWLGPPHQGSPACNRALVHEAGDEPLLVPAGHYFVYASAGPLATLARTEITVASGDDVPLTLTVDDLPALAPGLLSTDLHVHGARSFDSSIPDESRVLSFAAQGVQALAATDHDAVGDYAATVSALGLDGRLAVMDGVETTGLIPFFRRPGDDVPRVIGHFNFWPVTYAPDASRGGAPWDELVQPGELFDAMAAVQPAWGLRMLNHPWDEPLFGRDLGYLRAVGYDPRKPIPPVDDGTAQGVLARQSVAGTGNMDFDVLEVLNGRSITKFEQYRQIWWALLDQGYLYAGAANSDSHGLTDVQIGWPRNLVRTAVTPAAFDDVTLSGEIKAGHMIGGYGVVIDATIDGAPFGVSLPIAPSAGAVVHVEVRAAPWIPVDEVRFVVNGAVVRTDSVQARPGDPFGTAGLVRYVADVPLAELLPAGNADAWLLVEAGLPLPDTADLDDDGVVDTTDNNHDGRIDQADIEPDEDSGPLTDPADPAPQGDDPRVYVTAVAPGTWPTAFTNPWLIDRDGDGTWTPPGLPTP